MCIGTYMYHVKLGCFKGAVSKFTKHVMLCYAAGFEQRKLICMFLSWCCFIKEQTFIVGVHKKNYSKMVPKYKLSRKSQWHLW